MSRRLLYVVTEDWYFLSHRLPMARAARAAAYEIHVATRVVNGAAAIEREGFHLHPVPFVRGRRSIAASLAAIRELRRIHRSVDPAIVHNVALQSAILGSLSAGGQMASVNALTGFGYAFTSGTLEARTLRSLFATMMRFLFNRRRSVVLVQNTDDFAAARALGIAPDRIAIIPGSGVDVAALTPLPAPPGPITLAFVARLLADKGIHTLIEAQRLLRQRGVKVELLIAGTTDPANPSTLSDSEAAALNDEPGVTWLGHVDDIAALWARAHIAVLPSRREGLPKSLLEAAACGRPMIATDVPGCRAVVRAEHTGLLVPPDDAPALAAAMQTLAESAELRARYGGAARQMAVEEFSTDAIGQQIVALYGRLQSIGRPS